MKMARIAVDPKMLIWARERAGLDIPTLAKRFPRLARWETGELQPTLRQLEDFARTVHIPIGYLFLPEPLQEHLPIPDLRAKDGNGISRPSPNLLETIYLCQQRQDWFCDCARSFKLDAPGFVGSATIEDAPENVAQAMRKTLSFGMEAQQKLPTWKDALRHLIDKAEDAGVLLTISNVVGDNKRRKLSVEEFRGFALAEDRAPLIFINGSDCEAGQMFTLAHELAHLWLGESGVSNPEAGKVPELPIERWCNAVAAEFLMPLAVLRQCYRDDMPILDEVQRLASQFNVCTPVILRRLFDAGFIDESTLWRNYQDEMARILKLEKT
jgi:Zn-dependent peptidase ImmA (M78 family)